MVVPSINHKLGFVRITKTFPGMNILCLVSRKKEKKKKGERTGFSATFNFNYHDIFAV